MTSAVRPASAASSARWIASSDSESRCDVASSRMTIAGVLQQHPGDRDALLLAARQPVAALADDRVVAVGQRRDEVVDARRPARLDELVVGGVGPGVAQVLADRVVEQVRVLHDEADRVAERLEREVADVVAVDPRPCPRRRRAMRGTSIAVVVLPAPDGPTSATSSPGLDRRG